MYTLKYKIEKKPLFLFYVTIASVNRISEKTETTLDIALKDFAEFYKKFFVIKFRKIEAPSVFIIFLFLNLLSVSNKY